MSHDKALKMAVTILCGGRFLSMFPGGSTWARISREGISREDEKRNII
jgi:hypothetical protein